MGARGEKRKEEAREGRGNRQNKKEGGREEERELALWEALRCHGSGPLDSFFPGSFVLALGGVGGLVWECPGAVWAQLGAQAASVLGTASPTACPAGDLGFCLLLLAWGGSVQDSA